MIPGSFAANLFPVASGGYAVDNGAVFNQADNEYFTKTYSGAPSSTKKFTVSMWVKRQDADTYDILFGGVGASATQGRVQVYFHSDGGLVYEMYHGSGWDVLHTGKKFRDVHAWYNIMCVMDIENGTPADRMRIYVNGTRLTDFTGSVTTGTFPDTSENHLMFSNAHPTMVGNSGDNNYYDGYMAEVVGLDGQALTDMSTMGETDDNGVWRPIDPSSNTFGNNGFYMDFSSSGASLGNDASGNGHNFTNTNSVTQTGDSPTKNFPTLSSLIENTGKVTLSEGGLKSTSSTSGGNVGRVCASIAMPTSGKYYWETTVNTIGVTPSVGFTSTRDAVEKISTNSAFLHVYLNGASGGSNGKNYYGSDLPSTGTGSYGNMTVPWTNGMVIGTAYDADNNLCWFSQNGTWIDGNGTDNSATVLNEIVNGTSGSEAFSASVGGIGGDDLLWVVGSQSVSSFVYTQNFGATAFSYTAPTGFDVLNAATIATNMSPTIEDGTAQFQTSLWSGNSGSQTVNQGGNSTFTPGMVIIKDRNFGNGANLFDVVRGSNKGIATFDSGAEDTNSDGVTFGSGSIAFTGGGDTGDINENGRTYVGWQWKVGGSPSSNGTGDITTSVSANQDAGLSIATWTGTNVDGATIGHGLGAAPDCIWYRKRGTGSQFFFQHKGMTGGVANAGSTKQMIIDGTDAEGGPFSGGYIDTVTSTTVTLQRGSSSMNNCSANGDPYVGFFWKEVAGYSKFGVYEGNGNSDGPFIELGFKPAWTLIKNIDVSGDSWIIQDNAREPNNPVGKYLQLNLAATEGDSTAMSLDYLSNGFKVRGTEHNINESGQTHIYMAFAEHPFGGSSPQTAF